jgi:hypothetical protein
MSRRMLNAIVRLGLFPQFDTPLLFLPRSPRVILSLFARFLRELSGMVVADPAKTLINPPDPVGVNLEKAVDLATALQKRFFFRHSRGVGFSRQVARVSNDRPDPIEISVGLYLARRAVRLTGKGLNFRGKPFVSFRKDR